MYRATLAELETLAILGNIRAVLLPILALLTTAAVIFWFIALTGQTAFPGIPAAEFQYAGFFSAMAVLPAAVFVRVNWRIATILRRIRDRAI